MSGDKPKPNKPPPKVFHVGKPSPERLVRAIEILITEKEPKQPAA